MEHLKKIETSKEYFDSWHQRLSPSQAETFENVKKACDAIEAIGPNNKMNPSSVGNYCQNTLNVPPAEMTIRNMTVMNNGIKEHIYKSYIQKRSMEYSNKRNKPAKPGKIAVTPSYNELAKSITDNDTRSWVMDLIQRWMHAENSYNYIAEQMEHLSREKNGLDIAGAITYGPSEDNLSLPLMSATKNSSGLANDLVAAIKKVLAIPDNQDLPYLHLNDRGALVWDQGTGPVVLIGPKHWETLKNAVQGDD